jgi:hypothetical protein
LPLLAFAFTACRVAAIAAALNDAGHWAELLDPRWRCVYATNDALKGAETLI